MKSKKKIDMIIFSLKRNDKLKEIFDPSVNLEISGFVFVTDYSDIKTFMDVS
jgi:hypothetical protein